MSETTDWMEGIRKHGEQRREEAAVLEAKLNEREADVIVRPEGCDYQLGFFRADNSGGVVQFTRWGDDCNWLPETKVEHTFEEIKALATFL